MTTSPLPNFFVSNGVLRANDAGQELYARQTQIRREVQALDHAWVGAFFAALFVRHAWLASFTVTITASYEIDDDGCHFRSYSTAVDEVLNLADVAVPQDVSDGGAFDSDLATDTLRDTIDEHSGDIFAAVMDDETDEVTIRLARSSLAGLLDTSEIDGRTAFAALFPDAEK
ncbi:hypothetical protein [Burkholderia pseudomallei]|uniref:Uncharacterized protein n=1 Tax=Burkholderia pseudomallei TaxID=28450 RepID=A0A0C5B141_BURPE|nr:hypothetical protein [Burkholderia pseudomallei]AJL34907.1 hypothetical protein pBPS024 [Burkholderia pseudomallei]